MPAQVEEESLDEGAATGSLAGRMAARRGQLERQRTEFFPLPGWEDMVVVELRVLGWKAMRAITKRHEKMRDDALRELYGCADQLIMATSAFYEALPGGERRPVGHTWISLARAGVKSLPDDLTSRQALFALVKDDVRIPVFWQEWQEWVNGERGDIDEEVAADFQMTG